MPGANTTGAYGVYATLALGSALALFLYPHSLTGILSASSGHAIRRNAAMLPGYSFMLGLLALVGFFAIAAGVGTMPEFAGGFKQFGNNFAVPALFLHSFPSWFVGIAFAAIGIGALVPAAIMSIAAANLYTRNIHREFINQESDRQARSADGEMGVADRQTRRADLHPVRADAIRHPAAAARRHLDHPDAAGGDAWRLYALVQRLGAAGRLGGGHRGGSGCSSRLTWHRPIRWRSAVTLPRLHGALHRDSQPRGGHRADARVQRHGRQAGRRDRAERLPHVSDYCRCGLDRGTLAIAARASMPR